MLQVDDEQASINNGRVDFLDNMRSFLVFLVILYHAGLVYESSGIGALFWIVDDPMTNNMSGMFNLFLDIFIMPLLFFVSGYFAPKSLHQKGTWSFVRTKFSRLIIPWSIAVLTLIPLYKIIFLYSRNLSQQDWMTYFYFKSGFSQSWLWFLPVLFLFNVLYVLIPKLNKKKYQISLKKAVLSVFIIALVYNFCIKMFIGNGWTKTFLIDFQNARLLIYFLYFMLGAICYKLNVFENEVRSKKLYNTINWTSWIPITAYLGFIIFSFIKPGEYIFSKALDQFSICFFYQLSLMAMLYSTITFFRLHMNKSSKLTKVVSKNSYGIYIIHTIVLGTLALLLLKTSIPSILKYSILTVSTYVVCLGLVALFMKIQSKLV